MREIKREVTRRAKQRKGDNRVCELGIQKEALVRKVGGRKVNTGEGKYQER